MKIKIRHEEISDYMRVEEIARNAFWNLYFPGAHEHCIIHKLRSHRDFLKKLTFVIEVDGEVEGAIFYTNSKIISKDGKEYKTISFGPVFISPKYHRKGLGKLLITHTINEANKLGYSAITTLGYPYHYEPYGFLSGKKYGIYMENLDYYKGLLVLPLYEGALDGVTGYASFSDVFEVTTEEVDEFDKNFPYREKKIEESQSEYEKACSEVDN